MADGVGSWELPTLDRRRERRWQGRHRPVDTASGTAYVALSTGTQFAPTSTAWLTGWAAGNYTMLLADVTGDQGADLIAKDNTSGDWFVAPSNGTAFCPASTAWLTGWAAGNYQLLTGDVNGDGKADIVPVDTASGTAYVALSTGTQFVPTSTAWLTGWAAGNYTMLLADVTGDQRADLIAKDNTSGDWFVAPSNGTALRPRAPPG